MYFHLFLTKGERIIETRKGSKLSTGKTPEGILFKHPLVFFS